MKQYDPEIFFDHEKDMFYFTNEYDKIRLFDTCEKARKEKIGISYEESYLPVNNTGNVIRLSLYNGKKWR